MSFAGVMIKNSALWCESNGKIRRDIYSFLSSNFYFSHPYSAVVRRIIQRESAVKKKEIHTAYKCSPQEVAGEVGSEMK